MSQLKRHLRVLVMVGLTGTVSGSALLGYSVVSAVNPSYFNATWQGCNWQGVSRIMTPVSQEWTFDLSSPCLDFCYGYGQWINAGGTYYTWNSGYTSCSSTYKEYTNSSQTELYGEHDAVKNNQFSGVRSTDATK